MASSIVQQDEFQRVRDLLSGEPGEWVEAGFKRPLHRRLLRAIKDQNASVMDLAVLVRHVLNAEAERQGGHAPTVTVMKRRDWPDLGTWDRVGMTAVEAGSRFQVTSEPWCPRWLPGADRVPPEFGSVGEVLRRKPRTASGDPPLGLLGRTDYLSPGQKQAVRAVLAAPPGSTLLVNLPTGSGKSLCAHLPALLSAVPEWPAGVVVVVVPTTALCQDQARSLEPFVGVPTAYHAAETDDGKEVNRQIWARVRNGTQPIVFTSPESLDRGLREAVCAAARAGLLRALVIDEAHIVEQWGDGFRSAFQEIAGLRRVLIRETRGIPFRTVLLTATLTLPALTTLHTLFAAPGPWGIVSAVHLRPEPSYWVAHCGSEAERVARVRDSIDHSPRPLILYTTRRRDAEDWYQRLRMDGYRRVGVMTGETPPRERASLIRAWAAGDLDVTVATSAFGLGIDQAHVRTVIHACVPETLDRFYQEVGRGGRDGCGALSLVLYTDADLQVAERLNDKQLISIGKGLLRWKQMFAEKEWLPDGSRFRVSLDAAPDYDPDLEGSYHQEWNARTLTLMCRVGLLELDGEIVERASEEERVTAVDAAPTRVVRVRDEAHLREETWTRLVEPFRETARRDQARTLALLREFLGGKRCAGDIFSELYRIEPSPLAPAGVQVAKACAGCRVCRNAQPSPYAAPTLTGGWPWAPQHRVEGRLSDYLCGSGLLALLNRREDRWPDPVDLLPVAQFLVEHGVRLLVGPDELLDAWFRVGVDWRGWPLLRERAWEPDRAPRVPVVIVQPPDTAVHGLGCAWTPDQIDGRNCAPVIVLAQEEARDPSTGRVLRDLPSSARWPLAAWRREELR